MLFSLKTLGTSLIAGYGFADIIIISYLIIVILYIISLFKNKNRVLYIKKRRLFVIMLLEPSRLIHAS